MPADVPIELGNGLTIPILYEDRAVLAIDKPAGWMLAPESWNRTARNLHLALQSAIGEGLYWARTRGIRFLRFVHRLDAETTGVLLLAKSPGALRIYQQLFESREVHKRYLAVVRGVPASTTWECRLKLAPCPGRPGLMKVDPAGKPAETAFQVLQTVKGLSLIEARPLTGRTHQIRIHLAETGHPVLHDPLYGPPEDRPARKELPWLALRAVGLSYRDPFQKRRVQIQAATEEFVQRYGFASTT